MKKKLLSLALALVMIFTLAACGSKKTDDSSGGSTTGDTIKIGNIGPQTGDLAVYGKTALNGIKLAIEEVNADGGVLGKQLELLVEDDKGDASEAVTLYNKLKGENISAIIGAITSKPTDAIATNSVDDGIPIITPTGTMASITEGKDRKTHV